MIGQSNSGRQFGPSVAGPIPVEHHRHATAAGGFHSVAGRTYNRERPVRIGRKGRRYELRLAKRRIEEWWGKGNFHDKIIKGHPHKRRDANMTVTELSQR